MIENEMKNYLGSDMLLQHCKSIVSKSCYKK